MEHDGRIINYKLFDWTPNEADRGEDKWMYPSQPYICNKFEYWRSMDLG